ncbi:MAG TPA: hypothetical protein PLP05_06725 [Sedimentisphaerales bacterium]|nr:hypothetical protein [Sedimentisphaerales bacterium]
MKTIKYTLMMIVLAVVLSVTTTDVMAGHHGGHSSISIGVGIGGPGPFYGSYWYGPRHHSRFDIGFYYGHPYYAPYYDYPVVVERPVVVTQPAPVVVTQPAPVIITQPAPVAERLVDGRTRDEVSSSQTAPAQTPAASVQTTVIWIKNDNGSQTPVTLRQQGSGFVGPLNEYYSTLPTEEQLTAQYGLKTSVQSANTAASAVKSESVVFFIDNGNGSKTAVTLQKEGTSYIGPAGEIYPSMPTEEQLKALYGANQGVTQTDFNVEITKDDGTKVVVALKKEGTEFVGPKGERYPSMPTKEQLKLIYGK